MRILIGALAAAMLAGCASSAMDEARLKSPNKAFSSDKPENVVAQCVQFAWQDESVFGVDASAFLQPGKTGGFTVYTRGAESFTDVQGGAGGTVINYYATSNDWIAQRRLAALATCL